MQAGTTRTACRTSSGWRRASRAQTSTAAATGRSCSSAGRRAHRSSTRSSRRCSEAGYELTERRQRRTAGGLREVRPHDPPRPPAERGARVPPSGPEAAEPRGALRAFVEPRRVRRNARGRRRGREAARRIRANEVILCGGAINSPQLLQLSGVGNAGELAALGVAVVHDLPGVGENLQDHLEVYIQYACTQPVSVQPALKKWKRPLIGAQWLFFRSGPGATNHFEAGGFVRSNDDVAYPNLMFHFLPRRDPLRRLVAVRQARLPGARRADVLGRARLGEDRVRPIRAAHPALRFNYLSTGAGPPRVGRGGARRAKDPQPARVRPVQRRRDVARSVGRDGRGDPRLGRARRRDRAAPVVHRAVWERTSSRSSTRRRCACTASTDCASSTRPSSRTSRTGTSTRR